MLPANGEAQNKAADFIKGSALTATNNVHWDWGIQKKNKKEHFNKKQEIISYCNNKQIDSI